jgi:SpoIID/LytB domain protein
VAPETPDIYRFRVRISSDPPIRSARMLLDVVAAGPSDPAEPGSPTMFRRPADGVYALVGHGWGHGRGMSQWGAYAAATQGERERRITAFYYPGTSRARSSTSPDVRVLLTADTGADVIVRAEQGLRVRWTNQRGAVRTRQLPSSVDGCAASWWRAYSNGRDISIDRLCGQTWVSWRRPARVDGNRPVAFTPGDGVVDIPRRTASGFERRAYRGAVEIHRSGGTMAAVNVVTLESYLRAVVPNEMPASWPAAALRAQAVAARTYAMREAQDRSGVFDVFDTTASQVYPGLRLYDGNWRVVRTYEDSRTDRAIAASAGVSLTYGGRPAFTQFSSSNGGVTARGSEPYLRMRTDRWDRSATENSRLTWTDTVSVAALERAHPSIGRLERVRVTQRSGLGDWGGRVLTLVLDGSRGSATVSGDSEVRSLLGTNSSYLTFR